MSSKLKQGEYIKFDDDVGLFIDGIVWQIYPTKQYGLYDVIYHYNVISTKYPYKLVGLYINQKYKTSYDKFINHNVFSNIKLHKYNIGSVVQFKQNILILNGVIAAMDSVGGIWLYHVVKQDHYIEFTPKALAIKETDFIYVSGVDERFIEFYNEQKEYLHVIHVKYSSLSLPLDKKKSSPLLYLISGVFVIYYFSR